MKNKLWGRQVGEGKGEGAGVNRPTQHASHEPSGNTYTMVGKGVRQNGR